MLSVPLWVIFFALLTVVSILTRSYLPIDETRYVSVAWDMWLHGSFLVPRLNGNLYSDKPPLLFWLFQLGWAVFGVNDTWPRIVPPIFGATSLSMTATIARKLWPDRTAIADLAPLIAISSLLWMIFMSATMFDMLIVFFTLLGVIGIIHSWRSSGLKGWFILGAAIGLGILAKGPVILLHTLPPALLAPWWAIEHRPKHWLSWYAGIVLAVIIGIIIALAWAIPAAKIGGEQYSQAIFWGQSAGRVVASFAHNRPLWWYLPLLPVILFPWLLWPALWRSFRSSAKQPSSCAIRFCLAWIVPVFIIFSLISGKQPHYLLPIFPAFALLASQALDRAGEYSSWDPVLPALFIIFVGCILVLHGLFPLSPGLTWALSRVSPYYGIILIASALMQYALYLMKDNLRPALMAALGILFVIVIHLASIGIFSCYDMRNPSLYVARLQSENAAVCYVGKYHGIFNFLGRLQKPLEVIRKDQVRQWAIDHPGGYVIDGEERLDVEPGLWPEYQCTYGRHILKIWNSNSIVVGQHQMNQEVVPAFLDRMIGGSRTRKIALICKY